MQVWKIKLVSAKDLGPISIQQTALRYSVNCGVIALLGMPLLLIYFSPNKVAVNDVLSQTRLISKPD